MWLAFAFLSALLLGFYDVFKKQSLDGNAVLPVLLLNTLFSSLIFLPFILLSAWMPEQMAAHPLIYVPAAGWEVHRLILLKSLIVLSSWMLGYFGLKHLPITIVGPINGDTAGHGARWCDADLRRTAEPLAVDRRHPRRRVVPDAEPLGTEGRYRLQT